MRVPDELLLISHANRGVTPPFLVPVARLSCDYQRAVAEARRLMHQLMDGKPVDVSECAIEPELTPEDMIEEARVSLYAVTV